MSILGTRVTRTEDPQFLTTGGVYTDDAPGATFPFGTHVAVVEVDTETGKVVLRRSLPSMTRGR